MGSDSQDFPPPAKGYRPRVFFDIQINKVDGKSSCFKIK